MCMSRLASGMREGRSNFYRNDVLKMQIPEIERKNVWERP